MNCYLLHVLIVLRLPTQLASNVHYSFSSKRTLLDFNRTFCHAQMLEYFLILSKSFCSFAILGTFSEWPWQWNESAKMHFRDLRPKFSEIVLRCVSCQGELSRERYYNSKRICTAKLRARTSIFFLSNRGTTCIFEICVQSFFKIVFLSISCQGVLDF